SSGGSGDGSGVVPDGGSEESGSGDSGSCGHSMCGGQCVNTQADPRNCGGCGIVCEGSCSAGRCLVEVAPVISGQSGYLAVDATSIYWTQGGTDLVKANLANGSPVTLFSRPGGAGGIAVDATSVYWTEPSGPAVMNGPLNGGAIVTLASGPIGAGMIAALPLPITPG